MHYYPHVHVQGVNDWSVCLLRTVKEAYAWITSVKVLQHANTKAVSIGKV